MSKLSIECDFSNENFSHLFSSLLFLLLHLYDLLAPHDCTVVGKNEGMTTLISLLSLAMLENECL